MGSSLPRPENPFQAHGLRPGSPLVLEFAVGELLESHITVLDEVGRDLIAVLRPLVKREPRPLPLGARVFAFWQHEGKPYKFDTDVVQNSKTADIDFLNRPLSIQQGERRSFFRLQTILRPVELYRLVVDGNENEKLARVTTIVDLSEGGVCMAARVPFAEGERLGLRLDLPGIGQITTRVIVRSVQAPPPGFRNWRTHCQFVGLAATARDSITRYLISRQLELGRKGQL